MYKEITIDDVKENTVYEHAIGLASEALHNIILHDILFEKFENSRKLDRKSFYEICADYAVKNYGGNINFNPKQFDYVMAFISNILYFSFTDNTFEIIKEEREELKDLMYFTANTASNIFENLVTYDMGYTKVYGKIDANIMEDQGAK
jgi:hypothetical protein